MNEPDYVSQPGDHHGPYSALSYDALKEAYERVTVDLSRPTAPTRLAKLEAGRRTMKSGSVDERERDLATMRIRLVKTAGLWTQSAIALALLSSCGSDKGDGSGSTGGVPLPPNAAPVITSSASLTAPSDLVSPLRLTATDSDGDPLSFTLSGGDDAGLFTLSTAGDLTFKKPTQFIAPTDADYDNIYKITVAVSDGKRSVAQDVTVTVQRSSANSTTREVVGGFVDPVAIFETATGVYVAQKDGTIYGVEQGAKFNINVPLPNLAPNSLLAVSASPAIINFFGVKPYYVNTSGQLVVVTYTTDSSRSLAVRSSTVVLSSVSDPANLSLYADSYYGGVGEATAIGATQSGTDDLAQDPNSSIGKLIADSLALDNSKVSAAGVHNVAGVSLFRDAGGSSRLAITDRGTLNDELDSVVLATSSLNLGWPYKDGSETVKAGAPPGLGEPLLSLPRNAASGHVLVGSAVIGSSVILAYRDGSFYSVPTTALSSSKALTAAVLVDRTAEFQPSTGTLGQIALIKATKAGLYVMNADGVLFLIVPAAGAL